MDRNQPASERPDEAEPLVGTSTYLRVLAWVFAIGSVGAAVTIGVLRSNTATLLGPAAILGAMSGFLIAGGAQSEVLVTSDGVSLRNMFRTVVIRRAGIAGLHTRSGIYIILKSGRRIVPTVYTPSLGKRFSSNAAASRFGQQMASRLGIDPHLKTIPHEKSVPSWTSARFRWDTLAYIGGGAVSTVIVAVLARSLS